MNSIRALAGAMRRAQGLMRRRLGLFDGGAGTGVVPRTMQLCTQQTCRACRMSAGGARAFRIIYFSPYWDAPSGGNKVIYQHIEAIAAGGIACYVFHPEKPGASYTWMSHQVRSLRLGHFDPHCDFLVFPEVWAGLAASFCIPHGFRYAIFVQNGYLAHATAGFPLAAVAEGYRHAQLILSISNDTSAVLRLLFPFVEPERILRVYCSVPASFAPSAVKEPLITYMPRKLRHHGERLELYLRSCLPHGWQLAVIDDMPVCQVQSLMGRSSIFLSLSDMEGYGLPPLEAALCGNVVVGYTGQGSREYFAPPIFREVPNGDFRLFVSEVRSAIRDVTNGVRSSTAFVQQRATLAASHSAAREAAHACAFARLARGMLCPADSPQIAPDRGELVMTS
jgi:glycosyltransferase involved in cell wall biosynthesis